MLLVEIGDEAFVQNVRYRFPRVLAGRETQPFNQKLGLSIVEALFKQFLHCVDIAIRGARSSEFGKGTPRCSSGVEKDWARSVLVWDRVSGAVWERGSLGAGG